MKVVNYFDCQNKEDLLAEIEKCDWGAGKFLHSMLRDGTIKKTLGEKTKVLLLINGDEVVSFCTFSEQDDIQPTELTPWIGFVYTFPKYRGHHYAGLLFGEIGRIAKVCGIERAYISTGHVGLYEKYGCEFLQMMNDIEGCPSRVYVMDLE